MSLRVFDRLNSKNINQFWSVFCLIPGHLNKGLIPIFNLPFLYSCNDSMWNFKRIDIIVLHSCLGEMEGLYISSLAFAVVIVDHLGSGSVERINFRSPGPKNPK